ncbi:hypothetical protein GGI07_002809 [Coemansia sp. Benny D115]|nr:hypothetical protein GGI07_002809 [Coemansia sp. Benny D115]
MIFNSIYKDVGIPGQDVFSYLVDTAKTNLKYPDTVALYDTVSETQITYEQLFEMCDQTASGLVNHMGLERGDVVGLYSANSIYFAPAFLGTLAAGMICCSMSSALKEGELVYQINNSNVKALFVGADQVDVVRQALGGGKLGIEPGRIIVLRMDAGWDVLEFMALKDILCADSFPRVHIDTVAKSSSTVAVIVYSSGTTGMPKGVVISHRNIIASTVLAKSHKEYQENAAQITEPGELCIRGPTVMLGYSGRPQETARVIDGEGFLRTGDVAVIDEAGRLFIADRIKELIKYKGLQVPPAEIEGVLIEHPRVADAAVIGVYDANRCTEVPKAYVVATDDSIDTLLHGPSSDDLIAELQRWVDCRVSKHKRLRGGIELVNSIPRNASGKILRRELRLKHRSQNSAKL